LLFLLLQDSTRLLTTQLRSLPIQRPTVEQLRQAGQYCDLADVWHSIDIKVDKVDLDVRTAANARCVHDGLMMLLGLREQPITRPSCIRLLLVPGAPADVLCQECEVPGCPGNRWMGLTAVLHHFKTQGTYGTHSIRVAEGSRTARFLAAYVDWARPLLATEDTSALFLTTRGRAFRSEGAFNKYLPRLLLDCAKLSWTRVRLLAVHAVRVVSGHAHFRHASAASTHHGNRPRAACHARAARRTCCLHADQVRFCAAALGVHVG
jgi:hypothetical protein